MTLAYLIDENLRGTLAVVVVRFAVLEGVQVDVVQVGDEHAPPLGTPDPDLLRWAQLETRVLVSNDWRTMPGHLERHLAEHGSSPGVMLVGRETIAEIAAYLVVASVASTPDEWAGIISYIP